MAALCTFVGAIINIPLSVGIDEDEPMVALIIAPLLMTFGYAIIRFSFMSLAFTDCLWMYVASCLGLFIPGIILAWKKH